MASIFHLPPSISRKLLVIVILGQGMYAFTYLYKRRHGNPMRMAPDEHGVIRFQSMREYLEDEIRTCEQTLEQNPHDEAALFDVQVRIKCPVSVCGRMGVI
eukprot:gb/GECG01015937.1/.p1 GENE.gb/GECG01015937.1/~~gb/GECG01015937.1/.p1  ORF type:complete len:101 (+),score=0.79 gb/GECG01015937.1/:1-303(+)